MRLTKTSLSVRLLAPRAVWPRLKPVAALERRSSLPENVGIAQYEALDRHEGRRRLAAAHRSGAPLLYQFPGHAEVQRREVCRSADAAGHPGRKAAPAVKVARRPEPAPDARPRQVLQPRRDPLTGTPPGPSDCRIHCAVGQSMGQLLDDVFRVGHLISGTRCIGRKTVGRQARRVLWVHGRDPSGFSAAPPGPIASQRPGD